MNVRTIQVLLFVVVLSAFAADFTMGCGTGYVYGRVTQKFVGGSGQMNRTISVNGKPFVVPLDFWTRVNVGDWVRYNGKNWEMAEAPPSTGSATGAPGTTAPSTP